MSMKNIGHSKTTIRIFTLSIAFGVVLANA
jgi:hypothetical protein